VRYIPFTFISKARIGLSKKYISFSSVFLLNFVNSNQAIAYGAPFGVRVTAAYKQICRSEQKDKELFIVPEKELT